MAGRRLSAPGPTHFARQSTDGERRASKPYTQTHDNGGIGMPCSPQSQSEQRTAARRDGCIASPRAILALTLTSFHQARGATSGASGGRTFGRKVFSSQAYLDSSCHVEFGYFDPRGSWVSGTTHVLACIRCWCLFDKEPTRSSPATDATTRAAPASMRAVGCSPRTSHPRSRATTGFTKV